jgi:hypothetical protein
MSHERKGRLVHCFSKNSVNACRHLRLACPKICCRSLVLLHYAHPPLEAYSGRLLSLRIQDEPEVLQVVCKSMSAKGHAKAERIFSVKNIAFRLDVQAGR